MLDIYANIRNISYQPTLCKPLPIYPIDKLSLALLKSYFQLDFSPSVSFAVSKWISPKRTRNYPYTRVYNTYSYEGKRVTLIPVIKDEGLDGDRDFIQWDTISLMNLLQTYIILVYYIEAEINPYYSNKITSQKISEEYLKTKLQELAVYKSDALHWNLNQAKNIAKIMENALKSYELMSAKLGVRFHSNKNAYSKIERIKVDYNNFLMDSRINAKKAQYRESITVQPKESIISGQKAKITIENYLRGKYYLTVDEAVVKGNQIQLIEAKHTNSDRLPSYDDVIDGIVKMILFTNLDLVEINGKRYKPHAVLKLTNKNGIDKNKLTSSDKEFLLKLLNEARINKFKIVLG